MKKIDISECHSILLNIAKVIHTICEESDIPYYMIGGTMLGAIRHKGFIPWDDDFDIAMSRVYYTKFIEIAEKKLPFPYRILTYENHNGTKLGFLKVDNSQTIADDVKYVSNIVNDKFGIYVDIFPIDYCSPELPQYKIIRCLMSMQFLLFTEPSDKIFYKKWIRHILRFTFRVDRTFLLRKIDELIKKNTSEDEKYLISYWSHYGSKNMFSSAIYGTPKLYQFEDTEFYGITEYDVYLKKLFGDYMKLPPKEKQVVHCQGLYWKE